MIRTLVRLYVSCLITGSAIAQVRVVKHRSSRNVEHTTLNHRVESRQSSDHPKTLVVVIGQPRGGKMAWKSLQKHVLEPLNADLATYFTDDWKDTLIQRMSRYQWSKPEPRDWGELVAEAAASYGVSRNRWSALCDVPDVLGGVQRCGCTDKPGVSCPWQAIPLVYRWLALQKIVANGLHEKYDWFVFTRSDELYLCDHPSVTEMDASRVWLPVGEHYGGWSDRHFVASASIFLQTLNITLPLLCNPEHWRVKLAATGSLVNIEQVQAHVWREHGLQVSEFSRTMLTVRAHGDPTRWAIGQDSADLAKFGLKVKYPEELPLAVRTCNVSLDTQLSILHRLIAEQSSTNVRLT